MQRRTMTRALALGAAALLALGLAACGDDDDDAADTGDDTTTTAEEMTEDTTEDTADEGSPVVGAATVVAQDFEFTVPDSVAPGSTITFDNQDQAPHTMTADDDAAFDSGNVSGGSQGEVTAPAEPGSYAFHCEIHQNMQATLTVA
jgi:plastocyanin